MHREEDYEAVCRCGHEWSAHEHYRKGTECSECDDCARFRPARRPWWRIADVLRQERR